MLRPLAVVFIELPLPLVYTTGIHLYIMAHVERSDKAVIWSWPSVYGYALPNQKDLFSEALDIVAVFHHRDPSGVTQPRGLGGSCLLICCLLTSCAPTEH
ncbi:MAG: hypothetical protein E6J33_08225 [Chloroflexi bacterium]|nr:MAG: hypothetical protein E6J33_08225 [Chloroflexota bacterium]